MTATGTRLCRAGRSSVLILAAVLVLLLTLASVVVLGLRALGLPVVFDRVSDHGHRVSIAIPTGWRVETSARGGQPSTDDGSSGEGDSYRIPDIHAESWLSGSGTTYVDLEVGPAPAGDASRDQTLWVDETCENLVDCVVVEPAGSVQLGGAPALEQLLSVNGATLYLATLRHGDTLVRYRGFSNTALDRGQQLREIWGTIRFVR